MTNYPDIWPESNETTQPRPDTGEGQQRQPGGQMQPEIGDRRIFLDWEDGQPALRVEQFTGAKVDHDRPNWPLWEMGKAEETKRRIEEAMR